MKRSYFGILMAVVLLGAAACAHSTNSGPGGSPTPPKSPAKPFREPRYDRDYKVAVDLKPDSGGCCRVTLNPGHKLRVYAGHSVTWVFKNACSKAMELGIGNFRWSGEYDEPARTDADPFEIRDRRVKVAPGKEAPLTAKASPHVGDEVSYKYDILDGKAVLLDPEVEIRPY